MSVKGVAVRAGRVLLLENERSEWELPGGKLELVSAEHRRAGPFTAAEVPGLRMPDGYKRSVAAWFTRSGELPGRP